MHVRSLQHALYSSFCECVCIVAAPPQNGQDTNLIAIRLPISHHRNNLFDGARRRIKSIAKNKDLAMIRNGFVSVPLEPFFVDPPLAMRSRLNFLCDGIRFDKLQPVKKILQFIWHFRFSFQAKAVFFVCPHLGE